MRWLSIISAAAITAATAGVTAQGGAQTASGATAGTYEVLVCETVCSPHHAESAVVRGNLVLEQARYPVTELAEPARTYATSEGRLLTMAGAHGEPNACFVLRNLGEKSLLVGSSPVGFTVWSATPAGRVRVKVAQSVDAGYVLEFDPVATRTGASASGLEYGPSSSLQVRHHAWIRRTGAPDRALCTRWSARAAAAVARRDSLREMLQVRPAPANGWPPRSVAGTYEITACPQPCTARRSAPVRGFLVVEDSSYSMSDVAPAARRYFAETAGLLFFNATAPNTCFVLSRSASADTYAGRQRVGFTKSLPAASGGGLQATLYGRAHVGEYVARISVSGDELAGSGWSVASNPFDGSIPPDTITGRRIGPPDRSLCERAAEEAQARRTGQPERRDD